MRFKNPENGYIEEKSVPGLWALLFGGLYFMVSGIWGATILWIVLAVLLYGSMGPPATVLMLVVGIVYAFLASSIVRNHYLRMGWVEIAEDSEAAAAGDRASVQTVEAESAASAEKICPFCAETIKAAAIVCRYCGKDLPSSDAASVGGAV